MSRLFSVETLMVCTALILTGCVESTSLAPESAGTSPSPAQTTSPPPPQEKLTKHDAALRFLTAYIHLDRNMALKYATPAAVSKLDWNRPHRGNIPYYDDKMFLYYSGGLAKVYFQEINGSYVISDLQTHNR
ncbi:MAG: hypothetical protein P1U81_13865 [Verrucomicrobiales bacterium]|jgi:hypothetical protein|nr:hypothetical protein [Verrucomicrobiales bacterium]